jgi:7-keto-8-aminopelargonate synthetase-like enzyme
VNYAIQNGASLSRARVLYFRHNDMAHLQQLLAAQEEADRRDRCAVLCLLCFLVGGKTPGEPASLL